MAKDPFPMEYTPLSEYERRFSRVRFERSDDGVLVVTLHKDGAEFSWNLATHREMSHLWNYIGLDPENKIIILTGTGEAFLNRSDYEHSAMADADPDWWALDQQDARKLLTDLLEIEQSIIAALNGPVTIMSQLPLLCDIILATPDTDITETDSHFPHLVPGDGHHIVWPLLMGMNRAKYLMLTQQGLSAQQALDIGVIGEIVERNQLLERAHELAQQLLGMSPLAVRQFRQLVMQPFKQTIAAGIGHGLQTEGYAIIRKLPG